MQHRCDQRFPRTRVRVEDDVLAREDLKDSFFDCAG